MYKPSNTVFFIIHDEILHEEQHEYTFPDCGDP